MITINAESRTPLTEQIVKSLKQAIVTGVLEPGQELPSARQLAGDLQIHWNTVSRAYRQLADEGIVFVAPGRKAYVKKPSCNAESVTTEQVLGIQQVFEEGLIQAMLFGMDKAQVMAMFQAEMRNYKVKA